MIHLPARAAGLGLLPRFHFHFESRHVLGGEMLLGLVLAFYHLAHQSFWIDETLTVAIVKLDWKSMWDLMAHQEANMGPYYVLMDLWVKLGDSEFYLRSLSVIFGLASIPMTYLVGSRLFGAKVGLISALIMTTNAFWLHYTQEARGYSLVLFLSILATYAFVEAVYRPSWGRWLLVGIAGALVVYGHLFAVLFLASLYLSLAFLPRRQVPWRMVFGSAALSAGLLLPLTVFVVTTDEKVDWIPELTPERAAKLFSQLSGGRYVLVPYFLACTAASLAALQQWFNHGSAIATWRWGLVFSGLLFPVAAAFALSLIKPVVVPRYFIVCLTPLVLLVSLGLSQLQSRATLAASIALVVVVSLFADSLYYSQSKQEWRQVTSYILAAASRDDAVVFFHPATRLSYEYYLTHSDAEPDSPRLEHYAFAAGTPEAERNPLEFGFGRPPEPDEALGARLAGDYQRVWLVLSLNHDAGTNRHLDEDTDLIMDALAERYVVMEELHFEGIDVLLYARADLEAYERIAGFP